MAAYSHSEQLSTADTTPGWRLQSRRTIEQPPSLLNTGGFRAWTNVPPVGQPDPHTADQLRIGRKVFPHFQATPSSHDPYKIGAGKRITTLAEQPYKWDEKHHFPGLANAQSHDEARSRGIKQVDSRAKRTTAGLSDPNSVVREFMPDRPIGVKMSNPNPNDVNYNCWEPQHLGKALHGDWNWNTRCGFRKVAHDEGTGEPLRNLEHPVAWPTYPGYPPDRQAGTNTRIDYALAKHGGTFKQMQSQHPDLVTSRQNRVAASDPGRYNQSMRCRHPQY